MHKKQLIYIILIAFFVGSLGSIVVGRFLIPRIATLTGWESLNKLVTNSPIVINRTTEVQLNEGINLIDLAKQVGNVTVSIYDGEEGSQAFRGLGVIMSSDGLIFSSKGVIGNNPEVTVVLSDGRKFRGLIRAADPKSPLVAVTIEASGLSTSNFGSSLDLKAGQRVLSPGISNRAFDRELNSGLVINSVMNNKYLNEWFSTETLRDRFVSELNSRPINPSAPMFNLEGRLVGMMFSENEMIVAENMQTALGSYLQTGKIIRPKLGLQYYSISLQQAGLRNLGRAGALVVAVDKAGPAAEAGIIANDLIYEFNGQSLENISFEQLLNQSSTGEVKVRLLRAGTEIELTVNLQPTQ